MPVVYSKRDSAEMWEDRSLLTGEPTRKYDDRISFWKSVGLISWATIATLMAVLLGVIAYLQHFHATHQSPPKPPGKRNLIMMVSDGMGPTSLSLTRGYLQFIEKAPWSRQLTIDQLLTGQSRTRSSSSLVTDSAAGATAFSCAKKSYNGAISILDDGSPCGTILEAAKAAGYMTGLVVTTRMTDATPAVFASHVHMRSEEDSIAEQMVGHNPLGHLVDLMFGGGRCKFLPNTTQGSCRTDAQDIVQLAKTKGYHYLSTRKEFDRLNLGANVKLPVLALLAPGDIPFEIDRRFQNETYPSLDEMARSAIRALTDATKDSDQGFFLMIEGSRIDHAGHANDPAAQVHEVLAYDQAVASVLAFLDTSDTPGVMISTSDHETGGLSVARQLNSAYPQYLWYPQVLANVSFSSQKVGADYWLERQKHPKADFTEYIKQVLTNHLGILDFTDKQVHELVYNPITAPQQLADLVSRRAQIGWSTHGHTAADVNIYTSDPDAAAALVGNHENTEVGQFMADYLNLDLDAITRKLKKAQQHPYWLDTNWMGRKPSEDEKVQLGHHWP